MTARRPSSWLPLLAASCLMALSLAIFYAGFFPAKVLVPGQASFSDPEYSHLPNLPAIPAPKFAKVVIMLIDALRFDFVAGEQASSGVSSNFKFLERIFQEGHAYKYKAYAHPPTVTLPRVKALVTGGIPSFRDYLNNFQSREVEQDNLVWQLQRHGKCVAFYGDDTWIKLFPDAFMRSEGTTSFFVSDTVIVDENVTRHVIPELTLYQPTSTLIPDPVASETNDRRTCDRQRPWDVLILHYLGLDHIGHLQGPRSTLMAPKQQEMDAIFEKIYSAVGNDTLIVLAGDHGMNHEGAHGGPSHDETNAALIFTSPAFHRRPYVGLADQIDLTPTLSVLLGLPIPRNSVGKLLPALIDDLYADSTSDRLRAYQLNADHLHALMRTSPAICLSGHVDQHRSKGPCVGVNEEAREAVDAYEHAGRLVRSGQDLEAIEAYQLFLSHVSHLFTSAQSDYDNYMLYSAIFGFLCAFLLAFMAWRSLLIPPSISLFISTTLIHFTVDSIVLYIMGSALASFVHRVPFSLLIGYSLSHLIGTLPLMSFRRLNSEKPQQTTPQRIHGSILNAENFLAVFLFVGAVVRPVVYASSSFVEEEHLTFYWMCCTAMFALLLHAVSSAEAGTLKHKALTIVLALCAMRASRLWNQSGYLSMGQPDIAKFLNLNPPVRTLVVCATFAFVLLYVLYHSSVFIRRHWAPRIPSSTPRFWSAFAPMIPRLLLPIWTIIWIVGFFATFAFQLFGTHFCAQVSRYSFTATFFLPFLLLLLPQTMVISNLLDGAFLVWFSFLGFALLLCRVHNVALIGLWLFQAHCMIKLAQGATTARSNSVWTRCKEWFFAGASDSAFSRSGVVYLAPAVWAMLLFNLGQYAYFAQGNSNSLATIDIAGAYAGLDSYDTAVLGLFVALLLYSGPLVFQFALFIILATQRHQQSQSLDKHNSSTGSECISFADTRTAQNHPLLDALLSRLLSRSWILIVYSILVTIQRGHLFIWSVFAPKLLYEIFHSVAYALLVLAYVTLAIMTGSNY